MSDSVRPHRWQPTRLPHPWDSPGKNTGVGCHFLIQCMKVKRESEVTQSCLTTSDPMDCSPPGSSIPPGIFQARVLEWVAIASKQLGLTYFQRAAQKGSVSLAGMNYSLVSKVMSINLYSNIHRPDLITHMYISHHTLRLYPTSC